MNKQLMDFNCRFKYEWINYFIYAWWRKLIVISYVRLLQVELSEIISQQTLLDLNLIVCIRKSLWTNFARLLSHKISSSRMWNTLVRVPAVHSVHFRHYHSCRISLTEHETTVKCIFRFEKFICLYEL